MKNIILVLTVVFSQMALATSTEPSLIENQVLFNTTNHRSVLDLKTDPNLKPWQRDTMLSELCYKNTGSQTAYERILEFEEKGLLFDFDTETHLKSWVVGDTIVLRILNGKRLDDGVSEEEATYEHTVGHCEF